MDGHGDSHSVKKGGGFNRAIFSRAALDSFYKLNPRLLWTNPVMFVVEISALLTTYFTVRDIAGGQSATLWFNMQIAVWLWITVLFANFAEALAEGRGKAQAAALRRTRSEIQAKKLKNGGTEDRAVLPAAQGRCGAGGSGGLYPR